MPEAKLLRRSFLHLPRISAAEEARLWAQGISDWMELIRHTPIQLDLYRKGASALQSAVEASEEALATRDIEFFARRLPKREFYRIAATFPESSVFLDIESTGLSPHYDQVTLVGWSVGSTYTVMVDPSQIAQLEHDLHEHPIVVTFNGSLFDLPFLTKRFETDWFSLCHVDLRYLAKRVGLTGGQKKIEQEIGLAREGSLSGITGAEAVSLWFDYKEGDLNALCELVRYNHADIEGMKFLFEEVIRRVVHPTAMLSSNSGLFPRSSIYFPHAESVSDGNAISISPYTGTAGPRLTYSELRENAPTLDDITIVGIDLTGSEKRKSGWASVTGQHLTTDVVASDADLIKRTLDTEPFLVSIDSPLSLPAGRISEFDDDPGRNEFGIVREAERLLRSRGVHVYPALLPSMQRLTRRGVNLATRFRKLGIPVIESYPGAAQDILGIPRKRQASNTSPKDCAVSVTLALAPNSGFLMTNSTQQHPPWLVSSWSPATGKHSEAQRRITWSCRRSTVARLIFDPPSRLALADRSRQGKPLQREYWNAWDLDIADTARSSRESLAHVVPQSRGTLFRNSVRKLIAAASVNDNCKTSWPRALNSPHGLWLTG